MYGKYKWRTNKNGEVSNGYQCRHQIRYRKRSFHEKQGLDGTGYCNVPSICEWKLDFIPDNNFFYIVIKGKKHPMKKKKRWYSYDIILPENGGRIYVIYCMYEEHLRDIGVI